MSSVLVADAKCLHSARRNVLFAMDTEAYGSSSYSLGMIVYPCANSHFPDLKSIRSLPGGFQLDLKADAFPPGRAPHDKPLKVAVPSDFVRWVKPKLAEAVLRSDPANLDSDPAERAKKAFRPLIDSFDIEGSVVLIDLDGHEEARLRRRYRVPKCERISPLFRRKPDLLETMLEERVLVTWDPDMTKFDYDRVEQSLVIRLCNEDESDLFSVSMKL